MRFHFGSGGFCELYAYQLCLVTGKWEGWWAKLFSLGLRLEAREAVQAV